MLREQFSALKINDPTTPPKPTDSRDVKIKKLKESLTEMKRFPVPHVMRSFSQWLAELMLDTDATVKNLGFRTPYDSAEGVFHLTESHGIALRMLLETCWKLNPATEADGRLSLVPCVKMSASDSVDGMMDKLAALPQEWTVVQLSAGGTDGSEWAWLSVLPTGPTARQCTPAARQLLCPPGLPAKMHSALERRRSEGFEGFRHELAAVLEGMESWIGCWRFLLHGRLEDRDLAKSVHRLVSRAVGQLPPANKTLALRLAEAPGLLSADELDSVLKELGLAAADWPDLLAELPQLATAKRQTLVLILDQTLDMFPWEGLSMLKDHPVTRIESLHILNMLYTAHAASISGGLLRLPRKPRLSSFLHALGDPVSGQGDLTRMRECLSRFLASRVPRCRIADSTQEFVDGLDDDVFMFAGHGSGSQVTRLEEIQERRVRAVVLLMGCESGRFKHYGGNAMYWGPPHAYHIAASPCVLGVLWGVLDRPLNSLTVALLHCWLPLGSSAPSLSAHVDPVSYLFRGWKRSAQPELLRALPIARGNTADSVVRLGFVARGLPVAMHGET